MRFEIDKHRERLLIRAIYYQKIELRKQKDNVFDLIRVLMFVQKSSGRWMAAGGGG